MKRLLAADPVIIDLNYVRRFCYWSWDSIKPSSNPGLVEHLHEIFMTAISMRLKKDRTALFSERWPRFAMYSCQPCPTGRHCPYYQPRSLKDAGSCTGSTVCRSIGITPPQLRAFGRTLAEIRSERRYDSAAIHQVGACPPERPGLIWNGEGGSVGFGQCHLTQAIIDLARCKDHAALAKEFRSYNDWSVPWWRLLRRGWSEYLCAQVEQRFRDEMWRPTPADPGRVPYFFLLFNDQRRKLDALQENADLIRAEMLTPFFDIEFLSAVAAANIDRFTGAQIICGMVAFVSVARPGNPLASLPRTCALSGPHSRRAGIPMGPSNPPGSG